MADRASYTHFPDTGAALDLESAIALLEASEAADDISVDLGNGNVARADGRNGLQGLLQRLRGHKMLLAMARAEPQDEVVPMRSGKPGMHPDVAAILDALKN